jgi:NAD+ diphosphatase
MDFRSSITPPDTQGEKTWWCVFRDDELLVSVTNERAVLPCVGDMSVLHLEPIRIQYLGSLDGCPCYSAEIKPEAAPPKGMEFRGLRELFGHLKDELFWLAGYAVQIKNWDKDHQYCGRCGTKTVDEAEERVKLCPSCGLKSYPRISPATITAVVRENQILLARARRYPRVLYSVIAGFVEPGETLERCVRREIREETGIEVQNIRYFGSQPWPFPNSLMIAFTAEYKSGEIHIDDSEIIDAGWFTARNLPPIPDKISIAHHLIDWFAATHP